MSGWPGAKDTLPVFGETDLLGHVHAMDRGSGLDERPVEEVSVVGDEYVRFDVKNVIEELLQQTQLVFFIEDYEGSFKFWSGSILEILHVAGNNLSVANEISLTINHVGNHHDLVNFGIGKF